MSFFTDIPQMPVDPILGLPIAFAADTRADKINLGVGSYKTAEGNPLVLSAVTKAEQLILQQHLDKEYLHIEGDDTFIRSLFELLIGKKSHLLQKKNYFAAQTVGGAGALRIGGEFLKKLITKTIYLPEPSWANHKQIFERSGLDVQSYPYLDTQSHCLNFKGTCQAIQRMPANSVILLHGCCHNPTSIDPTLEQWKELSSLLKKQHIIPFFDVAYQGFGDGLEKDVEPIRFFIEQGHEMLIAYSCSKNFGLYGERVGLFAIVSSTADQIPNIASQVKVMIRGNYSNPPLHGARIVSTILTSAELTIEWKKELENMRERIMHMRKALIEALRRDKNGHDFSYLEQQKGMFSFIGLTPYQVERLRDERAIYMPANGRINLAGLNSGNVSIVANALLSVL